MPDNVSDGAVRNLSEILPADLEASIDQAKGMLRTDNRVILLDVRSDGELFLGHIKGARLVPPSLIEEEANELSEEKNVPILYNGPRKLDRGLR